MVMIKKDIIVKLALRLVGWYSTRLIVVIIWFGVIWSILGALSYPRDVLYVGINNHNDRCLPFATIQGINYTTLVEEEFVKTYILLCNETSLLYCVTTVSINDSCPSRLSITVESINNGTNFNSSNDTFLFSYDIYQALYQVLDPTLSPSTTLLDVTNGHFFSLFVLVTVSALGGFLVNLIKLPPLLGMMTAGFLLQNVPGNLIGHINPIWSSILRNLALVIILIRGGLALDAKKLWALKFALPILAILPCAIEGGLDSIIAIFYLLMPWQWGLATGYLLSAISPAVVVPTMLALKGNVQGINEGITTLIVAAANVDVVIAISLFSIFLGLVYSEGSVVLDAFRAPIEICLGLTYGVLSGWLLWFIPTKYHTQASKDRNRFFLLFGFGIFSLFGARRVIIGGASLGGAGALGTIVVAFVTVQKLNTKEKEVLNRTFYLIWQFAQPVLFGLIGAALKLSNISGSLLGKAVVMILSGVTLRITIAFLAVTGNKFTVKEKLFIAISWLPKATVQAALGSIPLDLAQNDIQKALGEMVLTTAALAIAITAPLGATLTGVLGRYLLKHHNSKPKDLEENNEEIKSPSVCKSNKTCNEVESTNVVTTQTLFKETLV